MGSGCFCYFESLHFWFFFHGLEQRSVLKNLLRFDERTLPGYDNYSLAPKYFWKSPPKIGLRNANRSS